MGLTEATERFLPLIESELREVVRTPHPSLAGYYGMLHYHLGWVDEAMKPAKIDSGKRLRPLLCLLTCEETGGDPQQALPAACALELVHNFSLVHDDIQDRSLHRRGRRAVWDVWGTPHGINAGDGLFVLGRLALHRLAERGVPLDRTHSAMLVLDRACLALCEGQFFDMAFEDHLDVDQDQYLWMIQHKTARLFAASAQLGAIIATANAAQIDSAYRFGENLGIAFQIQDDILGTWGNEQATGKSAAADIRDRKKTLPIVYVLNHPEERALASQLREIYSRAEPLDALAVQSTLRILDRTGAREYAQDLAEKYYRHALGNLEGMLAGRATWSNLHELAQSLLGRQA